MRLLQHRLFSCAFAAFANTATSLCSRTSRPLASLKQTSRLMSSTGNDEVANAAAAAAAVNKNDDDDAPTVFDKILSGEWDSVKVYEDDEALAFRDVNPCAPVHCLVIPKHRNGLTGISKATVNQKAILGHLLFVAATVGNKECPTGYRIVINEGKDGAQSVNHLHLHVMGGRQMEWPPG